MGRRGGEKVTSLLGRLVAAYVDIVLFFLSIYDLVRDLVGC